MVAPTAIGRHEVWRTGDVVGMRFKGPLGREDIAAMRVLTGEVLQEVEHCFLLADLRECSSIEPEARKAMAQWSKDRTQQISGTAVYGVSFAMRALVTLTLNAIRFIGAQPVEVVLVKNEAEALRYVEQRRVALGREDGHVAR